MIKLRSQKGELVDLPGRSAVEITDNEGAVALVIFQELGGAVRVLSPGDPLFTGYCNSNGARAARVHIHDSIETQPLSLS